MLPGVLGMNRELRGMHLVLVILIAMNCMGLKDNLNISNMSGEVLFGVGCLQLQNAFKTAEVILSS